MYLSLHQLRGAGASKTNFFIKHQKLGNISPNFCLSHCPKDQIYRVAIKLDT